MTIDDFFKEIDNDIKSIDSKKKTEMERRDNLENFLKKAIQDIAPVLKEYEKMLKERNVKCELRLSELGFSLIMYFKDGGHHGVIFGRELHSKYHNYVFTSTFTNDDGKNFTGTDAMPITETSWSKEMVKNRIEKEIKDFFFYSERHGGY